MKKTLFTLLAVASIFLMANAAAPKTLSINKVTGAAIPAIDGDASDWGTTWNKMDSTVGTTSTASCKFQAEFDNDFLYFVFDAKDADMFDTIYSATWNSDCVEVLLCMSTQDTLASTSGMYQFRRLIGDATANGLTDGTVWGNDIPMPRWQAMTNFLAVETDAADGYVIEWKIPIDSLTSNLPDVDNGVLAFDGSHFRLEVQQADRTVTAASRTQQNFWFGTSNNGWNNSADQGLVTMLGVNGIKSTLGSGLTMNYANYRLTLSESASVTIFNTLGQQVLQSKNSKIINVASLAKGMYVAKAGNTSYKFIR